VNKVKTVNLGGKEYAKVADRIKQFREENPNGLIETSPSITKEGISFKARILKDKADPNSAEATGHSMSVKTGEKEFEKLETIAVGRALALLGYMASGEIASSEEMTEFHEYKEKKLEDRIALAVKALSGAKDKAELLKVFQGLDDLLSEDAVIEAKNKRKAELGIRQ